MNTMEKLEKQGTVPYDWIFQNSSNIMALLDGSGRVRQVNLAARKFLQSDKIGNSEPFIWELPGFFQFPDASEALQRSFGTILQKMIKEMGFEFHSYPSGKSRLEVTLKVLPKGEALADLILLEGKIESSENCLLKSHCNALEEAKIELLKIETQFEFAQHMARIGSFQTDLLKERIHGSNHFAEMFGFPSSITAVQDYMVHIHPEDVDTFLNGFNDALTNKRSEYKFNYRYIKDDETQLNIISQGKIHYDEQMVPYKVVGIKQDVTEFVKNQEALNTALEKTRQSNQDLENFAYIASHDLQEPLRVTTSYIQLLQEKYLDTLDERGHYYVNRSVAALGRMRAMIQGLLEYSRIERKGKNFENFDGAILMREVLQNHEVAILEAQADLEISYIPHLKGDKSQILSLFSNLLNNALKFRAPDRKCKIQINVRKAGSWAHFQFKDNGIGIEKEYQQKIFVLFKRLHNRDRYPGNGLGLAISKKILERHGSKIKVEATQDVGTTFSFSLPLAKNK